MTSIVNSPSLSPIVLVADDLPQVIARWERELNDYGIEVLKVTTLEQLTEVFAEYQHVIDAIILDGCMPGNSVNTIPFVRSARSSGFKRPIVAASSLDEYRWQMVDAGCSHQAPKELATELVADLLTS